MRIFNYDDFRYYPLINNFVDLYPEAKSCEYFKVEDNYYKNYVYKLICKYKELKDATNISVLKSLYEGKMTALYYLNEFPPLIKGYALTDNRVFDYDYIIKKCESRLVFTLESAEDEMRVYYYNAVKKIGKYFAYKELIKICLLFKERIKEQK